MNLTQPSVLNQQFERMATVKAIDELAVVGDLGEGKTIDKLSLPEHTETSLHSIVIPAAKPHECGFRSKVNAIPG